MRSTLPLLAFLLLSCQSMGRDEGLAGEPGPPGPQGPVGPPGAGGGVSGSRMKNTISGWITPDGFRATYNGSPYDSLLETKCSPGGAEDGQKRCLPYPSATVSETYFLDAACTQRLASVNHECETEMPKFAAVRLPQTDACQAKTRFYRLGAQVTPGTLYLGGSGCTPLDKTATEQALKTAARWFMVGDLLPADQLSPITATETVQ